MGNMEALIWRLESWPQEVIETQRQFQSSDRRGQIWRPALPHQSQLNGRFNTDFMYQLTEFFNLELFYYRVYREQRKTAGELQLGREQGCHIHKRKREDEGEESELWWWTTWNPCSTSHSQRPEARTQRWDIAEEFNHGGAVWNFSF